MSGMDRFYKTAMQEFTKDMSREETIAFVLNDIFLRWMVPSVGPRRDMSREESNRLILFAMVSRGITAERASTFCELLLLRLESDYLIPGVVKAGQDGVARAVTSKPILHRFANTISKSTYLVCKELEERYDSDARNIWKRDDNGVPPTSVEIKRRIRDLHGLGLKTTNFLLRLLVLHYGIQVGENAEGYGGGLHCLDVAPDALMLRVFTRLGLVPAGAEPQQVIEAARYISRRTDQPAVGLEGGWELAHLCTVTSPGCGLCPLEQVCTYQESWADVAPLIQQYGDASLLG